MNSSNMDMLAVESTNIVAIGYDAAMQILVVEFRGGSRYRYRNVPEEEYAALMEAHSKGAYLAKRIARNAAYPCEKLPPENQYATELS